MRPSSYVAIVSLLLIALACWLNGSAQAAPATPDVECVEWASVPPWSITRCEDWQSGEVCLVASSGFVVCKLEG